jgi:hypothetical protein
MRKQQYTKTKLSTTGKKSVSYIQKIMPLVKVLGLEQRLLLMLLIHNQKTKKYLRTPLSQHQRGNAHVMQFCACLET